MIVASINAHVCSCWHMARNAFDTLAAELMVVMVGRVVLFAGMAL
jgi:hypothetical protein